eukprot:gene20715-24825_t
MWNPGDASVLSSRALYFACSILLTASVAADIPKNINFALFTSDPALWTITERMSIDSWRNLNTDHTITVWDGPTASSFVRDNYPKLHEMYTRANAAVKANLFRYLVLYKVGGIYSEAEMICIRPVSNWQNGTNTDAPFRSFEVNFIAGIEAATSSHAELEDFSLVSPVQLSQWAFGAAPGHAILACAHDFFLKNAESLQRRKLWTWLDVLDLTGPGVLTRCARDFLEDQQVHISQLQRGGRVSDLQIFGINAFGSLQSHSGAWDPPAAGSCGELPCIDPRQAQQHGVLAQRRFRPSGPENRRSTQTLTHPFRDTPAEAPESLAATPHFGLTWGQYLVRGCLSVALIVTLLVSFSYLIVARRALPSRHHTRRIGLRMCLCLAVLFVTLLGLFLTRREDQPRRRHSARFLRATCPPEIELGEKAVLHLTFRNTGHEVWRGGLGVRIAPTTALAPLQAVGTGHMDVTLPGEELHHKLTLQFLQCPGTRREYSWGVQRKGIWYGEPSRPLGVRCLQTKLLSTFTGIGGVSSGEKVPKGAVRRLQVRFLNTGTKTWAPGEVALVLVNPTKLSPRGAASADLQQPVGGQSEAAFHMELAFESECSGHVDMQWRLKKLKVEEDDAEIWFGATTTSISLVCVPPLADARITQVFGLPDAIDVSQELPSLRIHVINTGAVTWRRGEHFLGLRDTRIHNRDRRPRDLIPLPVVAVKPYGFVEFSVPLLPDLAQCAAGRLVLQYQMVTRHHGWFGAATPKSTISCARIPCVDLDTSIRGADFVRDYKRLAAAHTKPELKVPTFIHQSWKGDTLCTANQRKWIGSWKLQHPEWLHVWWNDTELDAVVASLMPELLETYSAFPKDIFRLDVVRYLLLYQFGGVYADIDMEAYKPLDPLVRRYDAFLPTEPEGHSVLQHLQDRTICNAVMASRPLHPVWKEFLTFIQQNSITSVKKGVGPVEVTGPKALSDFLSVRPKGFEDIEIFSDEYFMPHIASHKVLEFKELCKQ